MENMAKISVCIPFYNIEAFAGRCLDSVLNNTYKNLEIICVNDGSTDGTLEILHEYEKKDPRIIVIDKPNGGTMSARNAAINVATGDFIAFVDGDDWIHHQYFDALMFVQSKTNAEVVVCEHIQCAGPEKELEIDLSKITCQVHPITYVLHNNYVRSMIWGRLYARQLLFPICDAQNIHLGEDTVFNLSFMCKKPDLVIAYFREKMYYYYQREGSLVHIIPHNYHIKVSRYFMMHYDETNGVQAKDILLHEVIRNVSAYRYLQMFVPDQTEVKATCRELYTFCRKRWNGIFSRKEKVKYSTLYHCPAFYRLFRIITDPTMLDWERAEKKRQREKAGK